MELLSGLKTYLYLYILYALLHEYAATRCFECQNTPYPRACSKITVCNSDEHCFTEQIITTSGNVVYNTGCLYNQRCAIVRDQNEGKQSRNITRRNNVDISTCVECCTGDFYNNAGCGTTAVPVDQRGPYCFHCDSVLNPNMCNNVAVCLPDEICLLYSPSDFAGLPETIYRSSCARKSKCDELTQTDGISSCTPYCCDTDFCNNKCGIPPDNNTTTPIVPTKSSITPTKEALTTVTSQVTKKPSCSPPLHNHTHCHGDGYTLISDGHKQTLCVHFVTQEVTWDKARETCQGEGGDLVVLDNNDKGNLLRHTLAKSNYAQTNFWIGLRDFDENKHFGWVDCARFISTRTDWASNKPSFSSHVARACVSNNKPDFKWHNRDCNIPSGFVCERK